MARGYQTNEIKQKLVDVLQDSKTGMSGVELAEKLGVNRITITKYLNVFAAEGLIREKKIVNPNQTRHRWQMTCLLMMRPSIHQNKML